MKALKSIGSKTLMIPAIKRALEDAGGKPGESLLVDVFGGSGTVVMNAGYSKRVYNDADGDLVNFFRVLRDDDLRPKLLRKLKNFPMSRFEFDRLSEIYAGGGLSFHRLEPVDRAAATFYRSNYAFGGKLRSGGFSVSGSDRGSVKECLTYRRRLRDFSRLADFWRNTVIENGDFQQIIQRYGKRPGAVLYCDPPYYGTEGYYSRTMGPGDHVFLAEQLSTARAGAVVSYYDFPGIEDLYPLNQWEHRRINATKNSAVGVVGDYTAEELLLLKR